MSMRRTIYGSVDHVAALLGCPVPETYQKVTTLNTELGFERDAMTNPGEKRLLRGFVMGIGAHSYTTGVENIPLPTTKSHTARDAGLFRLIPLALREVGSDLSENMRRRYAGRKIINIRGTDYIAYYVYRVDATSASIVTDERTIQDGRITEQVPFTPTASYRQPTPVENDPQVVNLLTGKVLSAYATVMISMDSAAVAELLNAAVVMYGSEDYAYVSEIGLVIGSDREVNSPNGAGTLLFNELIAANIFAHIPTMLNMRERSSGMSLSYNIGAPEPLYVRAA